MARSRQRSDAPDPVRVAFANRLYKMLGDREWNQAELARRAGTNRSNISNYMCHRALPDDRMLTKLAAALGVDPNELLPNNAATAVSILNTPSANVLRLDREVEPGRSRLVVDMMLPSKLALSIVNLIDDSDPAE